MGLDVRSKISSDKRENAKINRDSAINPLDSDPGMEDDFGWGGSDTSFDGFGGGSSGGFDSGFGGGFDTGFGGGGGGFDTGFGGGSPFGSPFGGQQEQKANEPKSQEDKVFEVLGNGVKKSTNFTKAVILACKEYTMEQKYATGHMMVITSIVSGVLGVILLLFGRSFGIHLVVGGFLAAAPGAYFLLSSWGVLVSDDYTPMPVAAPEQPAQDFAAPSWDMDESEFSDFDDDDGFDDDDFGDDDGFGSIDSQSDAFSGFDISNDDEPTADASALLSNLDMVDTRMLTRSYIFEIFQGYLPHHNKTFNQTVPIPESSIDFDSWAAIVEEAGGICKTGKQEDLPYLLSVKERLFYYILEIKRVGWLKNETQFTNEIAKIVAFDSNTAKLDPNIYALSTSVGDRIFVKVMKGDTALVTLKDSYLSVKDFILDPKNSLPIVLGIDQEGEVVVEDFKTIDSLLIAGMPRSGKSWEMLAIIGQMCMFTPPSELNFYFADPKDHMSDLRVITPPHVRKFVSKQADIIAMITHVVRVEGPRRKKIIGEAGFVNFNDYKAKNPNVSMPLLYVVLDEVISIVKNMTDAENKEFQNLLFELISQLPGAGIRLMMVPHLIKDNIIKKNVTDLIPCRMSVKGSPEHIEGCTGTRNFEHKLVHNGDMAVRLGNKETSFVHGVAITTQNEANKEFFAFLTNFWLKIEPDSYKGSFKEMLDNMENAKSAPVQKTNITYEKAEPKPHKGLSASDTSDLLASAHSDFNAVESNNFDFGVSENNDFGTDSEEPWDNGSSGGFDDDFWN